MFALVGVGETEKERGVWINRGFSWCEKSMKCCDGPLASPGQENGPTGFLSGSLAPFNHEETIMNISLEAHNQPVKLKRPDLARRFKATMLWVDKIWIGAGEEVMRLRYGY